MTYSAVEDRKDWGEFDPNRQSEFAQMITTTADSTFEMVKSMLWNAFNSSKSRHFPWWPGEPEFLYFDRPLFDFLTGEYLATVREWGWYAVIDNEYINKEN